MIEKILINNYGVHQKIDWNNLSNINLIIGANGCGKSFILKSIYTAMKTIEACGRGQNNKSAPEILIDKLYWTFQAKTIGDLVKKGSSCGLEYDMVLDGHSFRYSFGESTTKTISNVTNDCGVRSSNTVFIPEKEVLSICSIIRKSREQDSVFGFDDTYLDLVRAISIPTQKGNNYQSFSKSRQILRNIIGGSVEYNPSSDIWTYHRGNMKFSIGATAEGVKKIAILDQLLGNRYLDNHSILILDEPESGIHPGAISQLMDILLLLAQSGMQIFIASHSYFILKKTYLLALKNRISIPLLSLENDTEAPVNYYDLQDGMPNNSIVNESIRLYEEEVDEVL